MPDKKRQHFVPQHYLRQFRIGESKQVAIATVAPFRFIGVGAIKRQCQEDYFYGKDEPWDDLLTATETDVAPVLVQITGKREFNAEELAVINLMAVILHKRTRKAVEAFKITPRYMATKITEHAVKHGKLPPYPDRELKDEMWGLMIQRAIFCWMEMQTLGCKLLQSPAGSCFISSDNPVVILNQFCIGADPNRSFVGFSKSGFQLLLPISPNLCLFFYDETIYKVGNRHDQMVEISKQDVEIINALQIQSAEKCLYFHNLELEQQIQRLVFLYAGLRVPIQETLKVIPIKDTNKEFLYSHVPSVKLPTAWNFCRHRKRVSFRPGDLRKPARTALAQEFIRDIEQNRNEENIFIRLKKFHQRFKENSTR
jgi:hypothetical protein